MEYVNQNLNMRACLNSLVLGLGVWEAEVLWAVRKKQRRVERARISEATAWG